MRELELGVSFEGSFPRRINFGLRDHRKGEYANVQNSGRRLKNWSRAARGCLVVLALAAAESPARASNWTLNNAGNWNVSGNWSGGVPNAINAVADFSTIDITADRTVTNNAAHTAGSLLFGDLSGSNNWSLTSSGGNALTLQTSSGVPTINVVNNNATLNALTLAGFQGYNKIGTGTLTYAGTGIPVIRGGISVDEGELSGGSGTTTINPFGNNPLAVNTNGTLRITSNTGSITVMTREISGAGKVISSATSGTTNLRPYVLNDTEFAGQADDVLNPTAKINVNTAGPNTWTLSGAFAKTLTGLTVGNGTVVLTGTASLTRNDANPIGNPTAGTFGTLIYDNTTTNSIDRHRDASNLSMQGGTFRYLGNGANASTESFASLSSTADTASNVEVVRNGQDVTLTFTGYSLSSGVNLVATGGTFGSNIKIVAGAAPAGFEGSGAGRLERRVFINGVDFAKYDATNGFTPYNVYTTGDLNTSAASSHAALVNSAQSLTALRTVAALKINGAANIELNGNNLVVGSSQINTAGMILKTGAGTAVISSSGGQLTIGANTRQYLVRVDQGQLDINATINFPGNTGGNNTSLIKSGTGLLVLNPSSLVDGDSTDAIVFAEGAIRMNPDAAGLSGPKRVFSGGVMEISGITTYAPTVGTAANNIQLTNGGGFAAFGGNVAVTTPLTWAVTNAMNDGKPLLLNSTTATNTIELSGTLNLAGGNTTLHFREVRVADNPNSTNDKATISGQITSTTTQSHLLKTGPGLLELVNADNNYLGETVIREGRLNVNGTLSAVTGSAHGTVTVMDGGTLGGNGVISRRVVAEAGSAVAPGTSPGGLELGSTFQLLTDAALQIELGGVNFTLNGLEEYDRLKVAGLTTLAGELDVSLSGLFTLADSQIFGILDAAGGRTGTFSNYAEGDTVLSGSGYNLVITYQGNVGDSGTPAITGGNDVVLYTVAIPEPGTMALSVVAVAGLWSLRQRRRASTRVVD